MEKCIDVLKANQIKINFDTGQMNEHSTNVTVKGHRPDATRTHHVSSGGSFNQTREEEEEEGKRSDRFASVNIVRRSMAPQKTRHPHNTQQTKTLSLFITIIIIPRHQIGASRR
jgi:hypothetical protein